MKNFAIIILLTIALLTAGCTGTGDPVDDVSEAEQITNITEDTSNQEDLNVTSQTEEMADGDPELKIMSVGVDRNILDITVKNVGNATAESVYCGVLVFGYSNSITFSEYMTYEELREILLPAVIEGMSGESHVYETNYRYKETKNLTIYYRLESIDYLGNIPEGEAAEGEVTVYDEPYDEEYFKIAWVEGNEEDYVVY